MCIHTDESADREYRIPAAAAKSICECLLLM
jgi:hypothetical protein